MRFTQAADQDLAEARDWYERVREGLGAQLLDAVDRAIDLLAERADAFPMVHHETRRVVLRRFPYALYYVIEGSDVVIIGCFHARRDPRVSRERAGEHDEA